jgi:hypothetical protein
MQRLIRAAGALARLLTLPLLRAIGGIFLTLAIPSLRALAGVFLVVAAIALASDAGPLTAGGQRSFEPTQVIRHWQQLAPSSLESTQTFLTKRTRPWVWDAVSAPLRLPSFVFFALLGALVGYLGRHRYRVNIFAN